MNIIKYLPKLFLSLAVLTGSVSSSVNAVEVTDLYQAKVELATQSNSDKVRAQRRAFKQVLIKLTGSKAVNNNSQLKSALTKTNNYLNQFSYAQEDGKRYLLATFEQDKVNKLLQQSEVGIWGKHRPLSTVWIINEENNHRSIISDSSKNQIRSTIQNVANDRGLPINLPLMDLTDSMIVSEADIWGRFSHRLLEASTRYLSEAVLVIRISDNTLLPMKDCDPDCNLLINNEAVNTSAPAQNKEYALDWQIWLGAHSFSQTYYGKDQHKLIFEAMNDLSDKIYEDNSYVLSSNSDNFVDIEIENVNSIKSFINISDFLEDMTLISDVQLVKVQGTKMLFRLNIVADINAIKDALLLESNLQQNIDPLAEIAENDTLSFIWKG